MIHSIKIENYQSHKDTVLEFSPGLNVIVGPGSNVGKSAILRAINWVASNRPLGDRFVFKRGREKADKTRVHVSLDDWTITRIKTKEFNGYQLLAKKRNEEPIVFDKVGTEVPEKIRKVLCVEGLSYQSQLSPHFLIRESPGEIGRVINEATNLIAIDKVMKWFEKAVRESRGKIKFIEQEIEKENKELERYQELKKLKPKVDSLLKSYRRYAELVDSLRELEKILYRRGIVIDELAKLRKRLKGSGIVNKLIKQSEEWIELNESGEQLSKLWENRSFLIEKHKSGLTDLVELKKFYQAKEREVKERLISLGFCPVCKAKLTGDSVEHLLKEKIECI
jgi:exonuclease SbcC